MGTKINTRATCGECGRTFDLLTDDGAAEWYGGHDCEVDA